MPNFKEIWEVATMCWAEERTGVFVQCVTDALNSFFVPWEDMPKSLAQ